MVRKKITEGEYEVLGTRVGVMEILGKIARGDLTQNVTFQ